MSLSSRIRRRRFRWLPARWTVWAPDGSFVRTVRMTGYPYDALVLSDGRVIIQAALGTPSSAGLPLHLFDADGVWIRSFGDEIGALTRGHAVRRFRAIAIADENPSSLWSGRYERYEIQRWTVEGELQLTLRRNVPWFPPQEDVVYGPRPTLRAVAEDNSGLLWVLINVPSLSSQSSDRPQANPRRGVPSPSEAHEMFDTMIEVIDPRTGSIIVSHRHPQLIKRFIEPGLIPIIQELENGSLRIDVVQASLRRSQSVSRAYLTGSIEF